VYLTHGWETTRAAVVEAFDEQLRFARHGHVDVKTELQEHLHRQTRSVEYVVVGDTGPPHLRRFVVAALVDGVEVGRGEGASKKAAEQAAAAGRWRACGPARSRRVHLRSIRLRGFKSFADVTELQFEPGVAVVVGPNGSGKSNIVEAMRWAMAGQAPSELRVQHAADVLFGGSRGGRPPACARSSWSSTTRTGAFGDGRPEVSVMRRLRRDGESTYLLNRAPVRRLDVQEVLADAGLGADLHAVISQGRVEEVLLSRPADRRGLIEEAAGSASTSADGTGRRGSCDASS
jgi:hypothetical protein